MGGDTDKGAKSLTYLYNKPFRFYYKVTAKTNSYKNLKYTDKDFKWNLDISHDHKKNKNGEYVVVGMNNYFKPQSEIYKGKVYMLVNGCTHSTASTVSALAQYLKIGKLIGETPSGTYSGYNGGEWINLTLPETKIIAHIPIRRFFNAIDSSFYEEKFIQPEYESKYTVDDKVHDKDLDMEKALNRLGLPTLR